jgi:hypothetical protein
MMLGLMLAVPELPPRVFYGFLAAFYACFAAVALILRRGNNRAVDSSLVPLRDQLARTIAGMGQ